uniref:Elongation factor 1-gamma n=1 Tax=Strombidium rassoulzadegani TaxID=1082188 RepID=A0A7S3CT45_9SPIT|mmetsp:Transcript_7419/g.12533  ORF Transcript_7419/g.12533 Transcript_7419/m.12533 type:complete len:400 (+) Transcript_7419:40-1239(+)
MKLYVINPTSSCCALVRVVAELTGQTLETVIVSEEMRKSADFKAKNIFDQFPLLETDQGCLSESTAICGYLANLAGSHLGTSPFERSQVDQWVSFSNTALTPAATLVNRGIFGTGEITQAQWNEAAKDLKAHAKTLNTALQGKKFLVGAEATIADVILANTLMTGLQTVLDAGFRKAMKNVEEWATATLSLPAYKKVCGNVQLCAKPLKPLVTIEKKEEKKVVAPAPKKEEKVEKKKDNVESLPPSPFNVYDFKTFYINHKDKKGEGVDEWYKMLDWEGWSFWFLHYEKYTGEGEKLHVTNNLMNGFLTRAEHTSKYTFGRHCVLGEEPNLEIMGCWLMRGQELPDGLVKEHPQFEYYKSRKMDPRNNKADDTLVREFFAAKEGETINGMLAQTLRYHK